MIIETIRVGQLETNCYLVGDPKALVVIDPGEEGEKIVAAIEEKGYKVSYIFLTHCHYDHIGAVSYVAEKTGAKLLLGAEEKENYFNRRVSLCGYFSKTPPLVEPLKTYADGESFTAGAYTYRVIHTPGHTNGSVCLLCENALFSGDTIFCLGIGRADFPTGNLAQLIASIKEKIFCLDDTVTIYPGHGAMTTVGYEKEHNTVYEWEQLI